MSKSYVDEEVMDISEVEKKVLLAIHKIVKETNLFAQTSILHKKLGMDYFYLGNVLYRMKNKGFIVTPSKAKRGRYKPSKMALNWIQKTKRRKK